LREVDFLIKVCCS